MMHSTRMLNTAKWSCLMSIGWCLSACDSNSNGKSDVSSSQAAVSQTQGAIEVQSPVPDQPEKKSIIRSDIEQTPAEAPELEPLQLVVPFPQKGYSLDDTDLALIDGVVASQVFQAGGNITIWGHSDSGGSDGANLAASRRRAEVVRAYLEAKGADKKRITVIPMGEGRPIAPNRKLDGTEDPDGRSKNRRVEIRVDLPAPPLEANLKNNPAPPPS